MKERKISKAVIRINEEKARMIIADALERYDINNPKNDFSYINYIIQMKNLITDYYLSKDFFREWKDVFEKQEKFHLYDEYEGNYYKHIIHNLKELKKANIKFEIINFLEND